MADADPVEAVLRRLTDDPDFLETFAAHPVAALGRHRLTELQLILLGVGIADVVAGVDPVTERTRRAALFGLARQARYGAGPRTGGDSNLD